MLGFYWQCILRWIKLVFPFWVWGCYLSWRSDLFFRNRTGTSSAGNHLKAISQGWLLIYFKIPIFFQYLSHMVYVLPSVSSLKMLITDVHLELIASVLFGGLNLSLLGEMISWHLLLRHSKISIFSQYLLFGVQ